MSTRIRGVAARLLRPVPFGAVLLTAAALLLTVLVDAAPAQKGKGNPNPGIAPIHSNSHGFSYGEWQARFWQWYFSIPLAENPVFDATGELFATGQVGPVWFLPGGFGDGIVREDHLPPGKALYAPLVTAVFWSKYHVAGDPDNIFSDLGDAKRIAEDVFGLDPDTLSDEELLRLLALYVMEFADGSITIDGKVVKDLKSYLSATPAFATPDQDFLADLGLVLNDDNISVAAGYAVLINPLSAGKHTIHISASLKLPDEEPLSYLNFAADITHHITVAAK